jgi:hypothetical protein
MDAEREVFTAFLPERGFFSFATAMVFLFVRRLFTGVSTNRRPAKLRVHCTKKQKSREVSFVPHGLFSARGCLSGSRRPARGVANNDDYTE